MWGIDALMEFFPDARVIWNHRTPMEAIASMCSMIETLMKTRQDLETAKLGPLVMDFFATSLERGLAARDRLDPARFIDVYHDDFVRDGMGTATRIYDQFGVEFSSDSRTAMESHLARHPRHGHGKHEYDLEAYGLVAGDIEERFAAYVNRFDLIWD